jgi:hypothetical protein
LSHNKKVVTMNAEGSGVVPHNSIRLLHEEARQRAALVPLDSDEHEFYFGVSTAAQDHLHPENRSVHDEQWLSRERPAFRDGYLKTSALIAVAGPNPPHHLPFPTPD